MFMWIIWVADLQCRFLNATSRNSESTGLRQGLGIWTLTSILTILVQDLTYSNTVITERRLTSIFLIFVIFIVKCRTEWGRRNYLSQHHFELKASVEYTDETLIWTSVVKFEPKGNFMGRVLLEVTPVAKGPRSSKVTLRCHTRPGVHRSPAGQFIPVIFLWECPAGMSRRSTSIPCRFFKDLAHFDHTLFWIYHLHILLNSFYYYFFL